jgi:hypothetical protein
MTQFTVADFPLAYRCSAMTEGTMLSDESSSDDFWCPLGDTGRAAADRQVELSMTSAEWAALSRLGVGEWLSEAQITRLQELGLAERVFGQALLTRLGRSILGVKE